MSINGYCGQFMIGLLKFFKDYQLIFDQLKPLDRLVGNQVTSCYDLKSATDGWPLVFYCSIGRSPQV